MAEERKLNRNCKLKVTVVNASFKKDADFIGKQDPYAKIECATYAYKTKVIEEGGKEVTWNEEFTMREIINEVNEGKSLCMETWDSDFPKDDFLGWNKDLLYSDLIKHENEIVHKDFVLTTKLKSKQKTGTITFKTQYIWCEPPAPIAEESDHEDGVTKPFRDQEKYPINKRCELEITIIEAKFLKDADFIGKQDPFCTFMYQGREIKSTVKDDAGKFAQWNEKFNLKNVLKSVKDSEYFVLKTYDEDPVGRDFLGDIQPMSIKNLTAYEGRVQHHVELLDSKKKKAGEIKFKTEFKWVEYIPPAAHEYLDKKSLFKVIVHEAHFLKDDGDFLGKQDPFIRFKYDGKNYDTDVKDDAGKDAKWDETFQFPNILQRVKCEDQLIFEAYDEDVASSSLLCKAEALDFVDLVGSSESIKMTLELFDDKMEPAGKVIISTQLIIFPKDPTEHIAMNSNCCLQVKMEEANFLKDLDLIGKQDPYIQFMYDESKFTTAIQDDAGLHAIFDDVFMLENIESQIKEGSQLVMNAYDKDVASSDLLGVANAISLMRLCQDDKQNQFDLDIFHECKKTGNVKFQTEFVWKQPDPPLNPELNSNCRLEIIIKEATFLKDADFIGKQDPFVKFKYDNKYAETEVKDGAGKHAVWNEKFCLSNIQAQAVAGKKLIFETYDKDTVTSDWLGSTQQVSVVPLIEDDEPKTQTLIIFDKDKKKAGEITIQSQFVYVAPDPEFNENLNRNCTLQITLGKANFFKDADLIGKQDPFIQFQFDGQYVKSKTISNGGLNVEFNQTLELSNVFKMVRREQSIIFEALDEDMTSNDLIGKACGISFNSLTQDSEQNSLLLDLYNDNFKHTGSLEVIFRYIQREADPVPRGLNNRCKLRLTVLEANFLEDKDLIGKQDPYIQFDFGNDQKKTKVQEEAGKFAEFNEEFTLDNILEEILNGTELKLQAFDQDVLKDDWLGDMEPMLWQDYVKDTLEHLYEADLFDNKYKKTGTIKFKTKFQFIALPLPTHNKEGMKHLWQGVSSQNQKTNSEGLKAFNHMKIQQFNTINLEAKVKKLTKDEEKAKVELNRKIEAQEFHGRIQQEQEFHMEKIQGAMQQRFQKENQSRGINNVLRRDNVDNIKRHQLSILERKKAETAQILLQKKKIQDEIQTAQRQMFQEKQRKYEYIKKQREMASLKKQSDILATQENSKSRFKSQVNQKINVKTDLEKYQQTLMKQQEELKKKLQNKNMMLIQEDIKLKMLRGKRDSMSQATSRKIRGSQQVRKTQLGKLEPLDMSMLSSPNPMSPLGKTFVSRNDQQFQNSAQNSIDNNTMRS